MYKAHTVEDMLKHEYVLVDITQDFKKNIVINPNTLHYEIMGPRDYVAADAIIADKDIIQNYLTEKLGANAPIVFYNSELRNELRQIEEENKANEEKRRLEEERKRDEYISTLSDLEKLNILRQDKINTVKKTKGEDYMDRAGSILGELPSAMKFSLSYEHTSAFNKFYELEKLANYTWIVVDVDIPDDKIVLVNIETLEKQEVGIDFISENSKEICTLIQRDGPYGSDIGRYYLRQRLSFGETEAKICKMCKSILAERDRLNSRSSLMKFVELYPKAYDKYASLSCTEGHNKVAFLTMVGNVDVEVDESDVKVNNSDDDDDDEDENDGYKLERRFRFAVFNKFGNGVKTIESLERDIIDTIKKFYADNIEVVGIKLNKSGTGYKVENWWNENSEKIKVEALSVSRYHEWYYMRGYGNKYGGYYSVDRYLINKFVRIDKSAKYASEYCQKNIISMYKDSDGKNLFSEEAYNKSSGYNIKMNISETDSAINEMVLAGGLSPEIVRQTRDIKLFRNVFNEL